MSDLSHIDKVTIQVRENTSNIVRSKEACAKAGIDADYTIGQALDLFLRAYDLEDIDDPTLRNEFHDAMHLAAQALDLSPRSEALAGVTEQTLLREPYNGNLNDQLADVAAGRVKEGLRPSFAGTRQFNPVGHEDFDEAAPVGSLEAALALGKSRLTFSNDQTGRHEEISDEELTAAHDRAVEIDIFFQSLMGGRAVYQLSMRELLDMPVAFFGFEKTGGANDLEFADIPDVKRREIIENLGGQNVVLHRLNAARTTNDLESLGLCLDETDGPNEQLIP